nr:NAD(P)/FAD-dependent oxidoreductase [uncultured Brumimicrobium sp.]
MSVKERKHNCWSTCPECQGQGKRRRKLRKKARLQYQKELLLYTASNSIGKAPVRPLGHLYTCPHCAGSGLISSKAHPIPDTENFPHVSIIGAGIGGVALAVACLHRGIPFTLYERDKSFEERSQGYGLTLQQASKAIEGFGLFSLEGSIVSKRHIVHTTDGKVIGEWGMKKWLNSDESNAPKRTNIHIARQTLRKSLIELLDHKNTIKWNHQLTDIKQGKDTYLNFKINNEIKQIKADLIVGADGIRSVTRRLLLGEENTPLRYLDCIVILGICDLSELKSIDSPLLDSETVFQTANGTERIYVMPYSPGKIMWQLSFPMSEQDAKALSLAGPKALKEEAIRRTQWHTPIPQLIAATTERKISGYPVYDRAILSPESLQKGNNITLIGDAAHPMSPFKGQGANQALLDALSLARIIKKECRPLSNWREKGIKASVLNSFEEEMLRRSAIKVKDSAEAAQFLHSQIVLHEGDEPRGRCLKS